MKCYVHPEAEAVATCTECGKAVCETCAVDVSGKIFCAACLAKGDVSHRQSLTGPQVPLNQNARISMLCGLGGWAVWLILFCFNSTVGALLGLATLGLGWLCLLPLAIVPYLGWVPAVITGHKAIREIEESGGEEGGRGMAVTGLVSGYIALGLTLILCVVLAILAASGASIPIIEELQQ